MLVSRRTVFSLAAGGIASSAFPALAAPTFGRLSLLNLHTDERCNLVYREHGQCLPDALAEVNRVLRDHRTGEVHPIDPNLLDLLSTLAQRVDARDGYHVISGYRSPASNAKLAKASHGVATKSLHMQGKAIDIRVPGRRLSAVRDAALAMKAGGVGYYPESNFVHVDTGRVRRW